MTLVLVTNQDAGGDSTGAELEAVLREGGVAVARVDFGELRGLGDLRPERVVVAGGDGTVGPVAQAAARLGVPLGVVPAGTANDFARALDLPPDPADACRLAAQGRRTRRVDLALMDDRPFLNVASVGLSPEAARSARGLKDRLGRFAYVVGAIRAALGARAVPAKVWCDGAELYAGEAWQVIVSNSGAFGGGSQVGGADPGDGLLDVTVIPAGSRARLALDGVALRGGWIASRAGVRQERASIVRLQVPEGTPYNVDGELVEAGPVELRVEPGALEVVVA